MSGTINFDDILAMVDQYDDPEELQQLRVTNSDNHIKREFWSNRAKALSTTDPLTKQRCLTKCALIQQMQGASIPIKRSIHRFNCPHGIKGIFISSNAEIGTGCTIFQHVVIGSNTIPDSKSCGFPVIGNNVYIGTGASIIGNVRIGNNVRIGANCIVTEDVPDNCVVVLGKPVIIQKKELDNTFYSAEQFKKIMIGQNRWPITKK